MNQVSGYLLYRDFIDVFSIRCEDMRSGSVVSKAGKLFYDALKVRMSENEDPRFLVQGLVNCSVLECTSESLSFFTVATVSPVRPIKYFSCSPWYASITGAIPTC